MNLYEVLFAKKLNGEGGGGGGGGDDKPIVPIKFINFYDYDGTRLYSYTKTEWANVTALPSNPSHDNLTAQGWNYTKAEIDALIPIVYTPVSVGQTYVSKSGATEIDIELNSPLYLSPYLQIAPNGTCVIDWGDGSATDTVTGTSETAGKPTQHTYPSVGDYTIKITVQSGTVGFYGHYSNNSALLLMVGTGTQAYGNQDRKYQSSIKHIRLGNNVGKITGTIFACANDLETITIPNGVTFQWSYNFVEDSSLKALVMPSGVVASGEQFCGGCSSLKVVCGEAGTGKNNWQNCYSLKAINIHEGVENAMNNAFYGSTAIQSITLPSTLSHIYPNVFDHCRSMSEIHIRASSPPTLDNVNAFQYMASGYVIYVPTASVDTYTSATNWSSLASHIQGE